MVIESIRRFTRAVPFQPYEIRMTSGERHRVPHPDFISIAPKGSIVVLIDEDDIPHHLSMRLIEEVVLVRRRGRSNSGKKAA